MAVGRSRDHSQRDALRVDHHRAFDAPLCPVHRAPASLLAPARGLGDATIDGHLGRIEADDSIVGFTRHLLQIVHDPRFYPLVTPATQRGGRARLVGYPPVSAAEYQHLNELLEDHSIGYAGAMTAEGWFVCLEGNKARNCCQRGSMMYGGMAGTGHAPSRREASDTPRMIEHPVPALQVNAPRPYWRSLLA